MSRSNSQASTLGSLSIPKGYKLTEVGVIPEDWVIRVGDQITTLIGKGASPRWQGFEYSNQGMLFVTSENVRNGFLDISEPKYLPLAFHEKLKRTKLHQGDILVNLVGASIGRSCQIKEELGEANVNQAVGVFRVKDEFCSAFVAHCLQAPSTIERILDMQVDAARPNFSLGDLRRFLFPFPPLVEQQSIAAALSDVDALLGALDRLIAKKRDLKQAAMQQLLTGQTRLPGFGTKAGYKHTDVGIIPSDWDAPKVDTIIEEISMGPFGSDITVSNFVSAGVPVLSGANVATERLTDSFHNFVSPAKAKSLKKAVARRGDIVVTHRGTIGQIAYIPENSKFDKYVVSQSQFRVRLRRDEVIPAWVVLHFHSEVGKKNLLEGKGHTGVPAIAQPTKTFRSLSLPLPALLEQTAITEVLSDMDAEIAALEQRREKARALKQGMMQELLTGRTRLI